MIFSRDTSGCRSIRYLALLAGKHLRSQIQHPILACFATTEAEKSSRIPTKGKN